MEVEASVDAAIRAFLLLGGAGTDEAEGPPLELVFVFFGEAGGTGEVSGLADNIVGLLDLGAEGVGEALLYETDGEMGDVDADPATVEVLATWTVVPQPQNGSRTMSPSLEEARRIRSRRASGFWVG